jgi:hypothetical protein
MTEEDTVRIGHALLETAQKACAVGVRDEVDLIARTVSSALRFAGITSKSCIETASAERREVVETRVIQGYVELLEFVTGKEVKIMTRDKPRKGHSNV